MVNTLKKKIKKKIWRNIKNLFHLEAASEPGFIQNINYNVTPFQKKLLVSYLTHGFFLNLDNYTGRTVLLEISKIIKVFSDFGYCIDVIDCNDVKSIELIKDKKYNTIFGFGEVFFRMTQLQPKATSILYLTEQHPEVSYREEKKRLDYFYARHKKRLPIVRSGMFYKIRHLEKKYTHVITLSEIEPLKNQYTQPYTIFPTGIENPNFDLEIKNHYEARKGFLWLGSTGAIHKGLDLLIDIFSAREDINLHICGIHGSDRKVLNIPKKENIFDHGHINIASDTFLEIIKSCSYSILPSCSEGCSTSITTSMLNGLIPVVMRDAGFNRLSDKAIFLDDYRIEYIDGILTKLSNEPPDLISAYSKKVSDFAHKEFSLSTFENNFRKIINDIQEQNNESSTYSKTSANFGQRSF